MFRLTDCPSDLLLEITTHLELADVLSFFSTCTTLYKLSTSRFVWISLLTRTQARRPLACPVLTRLPALPLARLRQIALTTRRLETVWSDPAPMPLRRSTCTHYSREAEPADILSALPGTGCVLVYTKESERVVCCDTEGEGRGKGEGEGEGRVPAEMWIGGSMLLHAYRYEEGRQVMALLTTGRTELEFNLNVISIQYTDSLAVGVADPPRWNVTMRCLFHTTLDFACRELFICGDVVGAIPAEAERTPRSDGEDAQDLRIHAINYVDGARVDVCLADVGAWVFDSQTYIFCYVLHGIVYVLMSTAMKHEVHALPPECLPSSPSSDEGDFSGYSQDSQYTSYSFTSDSSSSSTSNASSSSSHAHTPNPSSPPKFKLRATPKRIRTALHPFTHLSLPPTPTPPPLSHHQPNPIVQSNTAALKFSLRGLLAVYVQRRRWALHGDEEELEDEDLDADEGGGPGGMETRVCFWGAGEGEQTQVGEGLASRGNGSGGAGTGIGEQEPEPGPSNATTYPHTANDISTPFPIPTRINPPPPASRAAQLTLPGSVAYFNHEESQWLVATSYAGPYAVMVLERRGGGERRRVVGEGGQNAVVVQTGMGAGAVGAGAVGAGGVVVHNADTGGDTDVEDDEGEVPPSSSGLHPRPLHAEPTDILEMDEGRSLYLIHFDAAPPPASLHLSPSASLPLPPTSSSSSFAPKPTCLPFPPRAAITPRRLPLPDWHDPNLLYSLAVDDHCGTVYLSYWSGHLVAMRYT